MLKESALAHENTLKNKCKIHVNVVSFKCHWKAKYEIFPK